MRLSHQLVNYFSILFLTFLILLISCSADFQRSDIERPFVLRFGAKSCPSYIEFTSDSLELDAVDISIRDSPCSEGSVVLEENPSSPTRADPLARYLSGTREAGTYISGYVSNTLKCEDWTIDTTGEFNFVRPNDNFTVEWPIVFSKPNPPLQQARNESFKFITGIAHLVINDLCLMTELSTDEIASQRAPKCFPANAMVTLKDQRMKRMDEINIGDEVLVRNGKYERINFWSHRDEEFEGFDYIAISTAMSRRIISSAGHYLITMDGIRQASRIVIGDKLINMEGMLETVERVNVVQERGLYNPHTDSGEIVVNGLLCSTYTTAIKPVEAHALLAPVRLFSMVSSKLMDIIRLQRTSSLQT